MHRIITLTLVSFLTACALKPIAYTPPPAPKLEGVTAVNTKLESTEWIDLDGYYGPEDIAFDDDGNMYCGSHQSKNNFKDGQILKIDTLGKVSVFCNTGAWVTGLHFDANQQLIACDQKRGLISVNQQGQLTVLANKDERGRPFLLPNDVDIASDGKIYFSNTSSQNQFNRKTARKILMEVKPDGGLFEYDPNTKKVRTLIDSSFFGNGVAVSLNDDFVLMVDLTKYRVLRYWLSGERVGQTELFMENLPGIPNGIARREDGTFWLGFTTTRDKTLDKIQYKPGLKKVIYGLPWWIQPPQKPYGMVLLVNENGEIIESLFDVTGEKVSEASSVEEHDGYLYLGGDLTDHVGKYKLD